jgi:hypothetical protein
VTDRRGLVVRFNDVGRSKRSWEVRVGNLCHETLERACLQQHAIRAGTCRFALNPIDGSGVILGETAVAAGYFEVIGSMSRCHGRPR